MSSRERQDRMRRRARIIAIALRQAYVREVYRALDDLPPGEYWVTSNLHPEPVRVEKVGTIH